MCQVLHLIFMYTLHIYKRRGTYIWRDRAGGASFYQPQRAFLRPRWQLVSGSVRRGGQGVGGAESAVCRYPADNGGSLFLFVHSVFFSLHGSLFYAEPGRGRGAGETGDFRLDRPIHLQLNLLQRSNFASAASRSMVIFGGSERYLEREIPEIDAFTQSAFCWSVCRRHIMVE